MCDYGLILIDCNMPFKNGFNATEEIREYLYEMNLYQPIIIAVTGQTDDPNKNKGRLCGMN